MSRTARFPTSATARTARGLDKLDFGAIDASSSARGNQDFIFDGYKSGGTNGHIWIVEDAMANVTHVYGRVAGLQFVVDLQGTGHGLTASDFVLGGPGFNLRSSLT